MQNQSSHPNAVLLSKLYADFTEGHFDRVLSHCADQVTFQVSGKSALAGKFTKANFVEGFASKLKTLSHGTFHFSVHDVLASDLHGTVLATVKLVKNEKTIELRTVHVWRFENGVPIAGYEYTRDLYQFDAAWAE
jgi:ketosteroid isomerase-like protein